MEKEEVTCSLPSSDEHPQCHHTIQLTKTLGDQTEVPMNPTQWNHRSCTQSSTEGQRSGTGNQCGTTTDSFVRTESGGSTTAESDLRDPVTITVKCNKSKHQMLMDRQAPSGADIMAQIACTVRIPASHLKLIHRGKLVTPDTIRDSLRDRAVFQAIGEVAESEEGLRPKDIDIVMDRIKVDRNTAIRALRATGDVVDAILHIGNR
ncbi:uncharacterized protein [Diadema antillarum]|uniref:uncharacterized protein n=1 Tax=Diadema antillarum TaxID=105358 RepID=UPI003A85287F